MDIVRQWSCVRVSACQNLNVISYGACARAPARMRRLRASARAPARACARMPHARASILARARRRARTRGQVRWCEQRDGDVGDSGSVWLPTSLYLSPLPSPPPPPPPSPFPSRSLPRVPANSWPACAHARATRGDRPGPACWPQAGNDSEWERPERGGRGGSEMGREEQVRVDTGLG